MNRSVTDIKVLGDAPQFGDRIVVGKSHEDTHQTVSDDRRFSHQEVSDDRSVSRLKAHGWVSEYTPHGESGVFTAKLTEYGKNIRETYKEENGEVHSVTEFMEKVEIPA